MKFGAKTMERLEASILVTETTSWAVNICRNLVNIRIIQSEVIFIADLSCAEIGKCCTHILCFISHEGKGSKN